MKKETKEMPKLETPTAENAINPETVTHPAEVEAHNLRNALADERVKTDALARRCVELGQALDYAILAEENRSEKSMFDHINGNCYHLKAVNAAGKRQAARNKKMVAAYKKACKKNAAAMCVSVVAAFAALLFGLTGLIHTVFAAILVGIALIAFGWTLNNCVYLLGRCK